MAFRDLSWDQVTLDDVGAPLPTNQPVGYQIFVDGQLVNDIPNINNPTAPVATINLAPGPHSIEVIAYQEPGDGNRYESVAALLNVIEPSGVPATPQNLAVE